MLPEEAYRELHRLRKLVEATNARRLSEQAILLGALKDLRTAIDTHPGKIALNKLLDEIIDPTIKSFEASK